MKKKFVRLLQLLRSYGVAVLSLALIERIVSALSKKLDALSSRVAVLKQRVFMKRVDKAK